jgi:diphthamide synthase (EF-2-diphthine--ammonia ligase)
VITCVDPRSCPRDVVGHQLEDALALLPPSVDPCGENGEFHTFCWDGPMFRAPIAVRGGPVVERDGFVFADLLPAPKPRKRRSRAPKKPKVS